MTEPVVSIRAAGGRRRRGERPWLVVAEVDGVPYVSEHRSRLEALVARQLIVEVGPRLLEGRTVRAALPTRRSK